MAVEKFYFIITLKGENKDVINVFYSKKNEGSDEIIIQKSRFIGYVKRVETEEAAQEFIHHIKKKNTMMPHIIVLHISLVNMTKFKRQTMMASQVAQRVSLF